MPTIRLLSAGAVQKMATDFAADFERDTGNKIELNFATAGVVRDRVAGGEAVDVVISSQETIGALNKPDFFAGVTNLGETVTCLFNRAGESKPDISTPEKFKQLLLDAKRFTYSDPSGGGTGGRMFVAVLNKLGIKNEIDRKSVFGKRGIELIAIVKDSKADIGATFVSEVVPHRGVQVIDIFPDGLRDTNGYAAGVPANSAQRDTATAFVKYMTAPSSRARWTAAGMTPLF